MRRPVPERWKHAKNNKKMGELDVDDFQRKRDDGKNPPSTPHGDVFPTGCCQRKKKHAPMAQLDRESKEKTGEPPRHFPQRIRMPSNPAHAPEDHGICFSFESHREVSNKSNPLRGLPAASPTRSRIKKSGLRERIAISKRSNLSRSERGGLQNKRTLDQVMKRQRSERSEGRNNLQISKHCAPPSGTTPSPKRTQHTSEEKAFPRT